MSEPQFFRQLFAALKQHTPGDQQWRDLVAFLQVLPRHPTVEGVVT
jgi:hypothetical protein